MRNRVRSRSCMFVYWMLVLIGTLRGDENWLGMSPCRCACEFKPVAVSVLPHPQYTGQVVPERLGLKPQTEPWIRDLRSIEPEAFLEIAADAQMIELQIDGLHACWKVPACIGSPDTNANNRMAVIL